MLSGFKRIPAAAVLIFTFATAGIAQEKDKPSQEDLEKNFSERMANTVMVGKFTIDGKDDADPNAERYEITSVTKAQGDYWTFLARVKYGKIDTKVPITVKILWAGDTPMVSLTDLTIPGLGTFTARVIFYENRYAGTWQHGKVGGHMYGTIEKMKDAETKPAE
jgi:hypothetical protein